MDKYVVRMTVGTQPGNSNLNIVESSEKRARIDTTSDDIVSDPDRRKSINEYDPRIRDDVRRKYVQIGPCQPLSHNFRPSPFGDSNRSFQAHWITKWEWLEYSVCENAAFCFWCYLFGDKRVKDQAFTKKGFRNWKKATEKFKDHIGNEGSIHNNARMLYLGFKDQRQSVTRKFLSGNEITGAASFCLKHNIVVPDMEDNVPGRIHCKQGITYYHHFKVVIFIHVVDRVTKEMDNRFSETSTELLMCIACLDPKNAFSKFSLSRVLRLAELYPLEFSLSDQMELKEELKMWVSEMRVNETFRRLHNIGDLAKRMVEVGYHMSFPLVYLLIELILVLPVATATVERAFLL